MIKCQFRCRLILLAMLFIAPLSMSGQDLRPGYIVTLNGDTVKGQVRYASSAKSRNGCLFRASADGSKKKYLPGEISGFGISGDRAFESVTIPGEPDRKSFARVLASGDIDLLRAGKQYLLRKDFIEILPPETQRRVAVTNGEAIRTERPYVGTLNIAMADCGKPVTDLRYSEKELTQAVDDYNTCRNSKYQSIQRRPIAQVGFNAFVSYVYSDMFLKYDNAAMGTTTFVAIGAGTDISSPRINDKLFLALDVSYADAFYQGLIDGPGAGYYLREDVFMSFTTLRLAAAFRYNFRQASRTPYAKIGFSRYAVLDEEIYSRAEEELSGGVIITREKSGGYSVKNPKGIYLGLGYQFTVFRQLLVFAEGRYENMEGFVGTDIQSFSKLSNYNFMLGVKFR